MMLFSDKINIGQMFDNIAPLKVSIYSKNQCFRKSIHRLFCSFMFSLEGYKFIKQIGTGAFSTVWLVMRESDENYFACKVISKSKIDIDTFENEARSMCKTGSHPNVLSLVDLDSDTNRYYMLTEYCQKGDLFGFVSHHKYILEYIAKGLIRQILEAVQHMHQNGVAHRDLKPENIFLDGKNKIRIGDFGLSVILPKKERNCEQLPKRIDMSSEKLDDEGINSSDIPVIDELIYDYEKEFDVYNDMIDSTGGSSCYASPECISGKSQYSAFKSDIWSLGMCFFSILTGQSPWRSQDPEEIYQQMQEGPILVPQWLSPQCCDFVQCFLQVDPQRRITINDALNHPWLKTSSSISTSLSLTSQVDLFPLMTEQQIDNYFGKMGGTIGLSSTAKGSFLRKHVNSIVRFFQKNDSKISMGMRFNRIENLVLMNEKKKNKLFPITKDKSLKKETCEKEADIQSIIDTVKIIRMK